VRLVGFDVTPVPTSDERLISLVVDVPRQEKVSSAFSQAIEWLGRLDEVVNVAGIGHMRTITDASPQDFVRVMAVNVEGTFMMCREGAHFPRPGRRRNHRQRRQYCRDRRPPQPSD
jgi:NAD(P)-dependent dehydrogenase (short-subunit alcohol dehydrogenase family)